MRAAAAVGAGQLAPQPVLHRRGYSQVEDEMDTRSSGRTILPLEASGEYTLGSGNSWMWNCSRTA